MQKVGEIKDTRHSPKHSDQEKNTTEKAPEPMGLDGYVLKGTWTPDYNKGLLWQIWHSGDSLSYEQYVHFITEPKLLINPVRDVILFNTPWLEIFSKTSWYVIPLGWSPVIFYYML